MPDETKPTEKKKQAPPPAAKVVDYWPEQKPFVGRGPYPATVTEQLGDGSARLVVENPNTGRSFNVTAKPSDKPASGSFTERAGGAAPTKAPAASGSVTVKSTISGA
jgi:hypothetical protein